MLERIHEVINSDAHLSPKFDVCQLQRCFCIRTGLDSFLDVARLAFTELIEDFNGSDVDIQLKSRVKIASDVSFSVRR